MVEMKALVVQWIGHRLAESVTEVRILSRAQRKGQRSSFKTRSSIRRICKGKRPGFSQRSSTMKEAQKIRMIPVNRCFGGQCPQNPEQPKEQRIKEVLITAKERRRANKEIDLLLRQFHHRKSIFDLLPAMKQRHYPLYVIRVAIERVEGRRNELKIEQQMELEAFKASLAEQQP